MEKKKTISKIYDSKIFWIIVSLIFSLIIWSYISNINGAYMEKTFSDIEVQFKGEAELLADKSLAITDVETSSVTVRIRGSRTVIAKLRESDIKAVIDVSSITQPNDMSWTYELVFPNDVDRSDITIISRSPDTIKFSVVKNASKTVPVKGSFEGTIDDGCVAEELVFEPEVINIKGPESILEKIDHAWVTFGKNEKIDATYSADVNFTLIDVDGQPVSADKLSLDADKVTATQPILKTKELPLAVNLIAGGGVTADDCVVTIEPESITVAADSRLIDDKNSFILGNIDLTSFQSSYEHTFTIPISDDIENVTGVTEATVKIEIPGVKVRTLTATNISCRNCSSGYTAVINTEFVEVTLRSKDEAALAAVNPEDIIVVVDLADYGTITGQIRANAIVTVSGSDGKIGAIGEIKVVLTIQKD